MRIRGYNARCETQTINHRPYCLCIAVQPSTRKKGLIVQAVRSSGLFHITDCFRHVSIRLHVTSAINACIPSQILASLRIPHDFRSHTKQTSILLQPVFTLETPGPHRHWHGRVNLHPLLYLQVTIHFGERRIRRFLFGPLLGLTYLSSSWVVVPSRRSVENNRSLRSDTIVNRQRYCHTGILPSAGACICKPQRRGICPTSKLQRYDAILPSK